MADSEINVKVTASTDDLKSGLGSAKNDVKDFGDQINDLAQRVAAVKPDAFKALATEFNAGKIDLDEFRDGLMAVSTAQSSAAKEAVNLTEKTAISSGAMREFVVVGRELASGNLTRLPGSLSILATRLGGIPPQAILAAAAIAGVGYAIYEIIDSSEKAEADLGKLQNAFTAVGRSDIFNSDELKQFVDDLRQIPGVSGDAANAIVNSFARSRNGAEDLRELTNDVKPFAELIGKEVPQAAKILAESFNDPIKGIQALKSEGIELTAAQQQQITEMMALNDLAGAQRVLMDALSVAMSHVVDTSTGMQRFLHNLGNDLRGVNEEATGTRTAIDSLVDTFVHIPNFSTRRLPSAQWGGSSGSISATDKAEQSKADNEAVSLTNQLFEHGNSLLRENELHRENLQKIQNGINAAEREGDAAAVQRAKADLETENKRHQTATNKDDKGGDRYAEAVAKGDADAADARIKTEQELVNEKLKLGEISSADAVKQLKALAAQEHEINLKRIADMRAVYAKQGDRAGVAKSNSDVSVENERYSQQDSKIDTQGAEATKKAQEAEIEGDKRVADEKVKTAQVAMQEKVALGQMSAQQEIQAEIEAAKQKDVVDQQAFATLLKSYAQDTAAYQKTLADKLVAEEKFNQQVLQLRTKLIQQSEKQENQLTKSITNGLNQTVNGVLTGTQTMGQAFQRLGQNIVLSVVEGALDKIVTNWLSNNSTIQAAQTALDTFLGISNAANAADAITTSQAAAHAGIIAYAGEGAAAAIASTSAIPIVGPALAPEAGAAIYADIMSYNIASAAGGMIVNSDQLAMVHENEMVLPARYTSGLTNMIDQANGGGGASGHTFNNTFNLSGVQGKDIPGMIDAHIQKQARNGAYGGMRTTR